MTNRAGNMKEVTLSMPRRRPRPTTTTVAAMYKECHRINRPGDANKPSNCAVAALGAMETKTPRRA